MTITTETLQAIMCAPGIGGRRGLRALFWGKPGIGKTAKIDTLARAMEAHIITIIASIRDPSDFLGLPMPDGKGGVMYAAPCWAREANDRAATGQLVVIHLDELTTCPPAVQAALLRVVNEGWVGDVQLHPMVVFLASANPPDIAAGGYDLPPPSANRWMHLDWGDPSAADFAEGILSDWASTKSVSSAKEVMARIDKVHAGCEAKAKGLVTGFLRANSNRMLELPNMESPDASRAWPSLRSWEMCIKALAAGEAMGLDTADIDDLIAGCVGQAASAEMRQFQAAADLPDVEKLLDAKVPFTVWRPNKERPDITVAVLDTITAYVCPKTAKKRKTRADAAWNIIEEVVKECGDISVVAARALANAGLSATPTAKRAMNVLGPIMHAMGDI